LKGNLRDGIWLPSVFLIVAGVEGGNPRKACSARVYPFDWFAKTTTEENWCQNHLADQQLYRLLEQVDADVAAAVHEKGCTACGSKLHRADYERKPRGGPQWNWRDSFCCAKEGCRQRHTPVSVRFMGRRVYAGLVVVLVSAMLHGLKPERVERLRQELQIDRRTLERWRQWWLSTFVDGSFWKTARARFMPPLCQRTLPYSLCMSFLVERRDRLLELLKFLAPITTPAAWKELVM
jgi:hypothetical protein